MHRGILLICVLLMMVSACSSAPAEPPPEAIELLQQATDNILKVETLNLIVDRTGADYVLNTDIGAATFNRMEAQYAAPDMMQAKAKVTLGGLPVEIEIFAKDNDQWWRLAGTGWQNMVFLPGFNPRELLTQEDRGLRAAFGALKNVTLAGETQMEDGAAAYRLTATADGAEISWLMVYLVEISGETTIDVYIDKTERLPLKLVVVQPDTASETVGPTTWSMEFYNFNGDTQLVPPPTTAAP
ncbi:MAG: LppX_LprAFG lipoprotein [Anaerolineae bacterium]|nr:LppX_LprAFG lipoprotein [Anaerolineae bacterium]MBN8619692.1 LppX_LprAFG lipoprotein [Anaerolineae bacterium]